MLSVNEGVAKIAQSLLLHDDLVLSEVMSKPTASPVLTGVKAPHLLPPGQRPDPRHQI